MIKYIPAELIVTLVGGEGFLTILSAAILGAPAYLNGYAAVPLVDAYIPRYVYGSSNELYDRWWSKFYTCCNCRLGPSEAKSVHRLPVLWNSWSHPVRVTLAIDKLSS